MCNNQLQRYERQQQQQAVREAATICPAPCDLDP